MAATLTIAVPAKGRLKDNTDSLFERAGLALRKAGMSAAIAAWCRASTASRWRFCLLPRSCTSSSRGACIWA